MMVNKQENVEKPNMELNASPYTIASLIGTNELSKMGIIFPTLLTEINQNIKTSDSSYVEVQNNYNPRNNPVSSPSSDTIDSSKIFVQNTQILKIQEPVRLGTVDSILQYVQMCQAYKSFSKDIPLFHRF